MMLFRQVLWFFAFVLTNSCINLVTTQSISSVDWEFQQVWNSVVDRENRIRSALGDLQQKLNNTIDSFQSTGSLTALVTALKNMRNLTIDLITINNYGTYQPTSSCNDVSGRIGTIFLDINMCAQVNIKNAVNASSLMVQYNIVYATYVTNYYLLSDIQKQSVQTVLTAWTIVNDEYNQYALTLVMAVYKYNVIYVELVTLRTNFCSCPSQLSASAASSLATVDSSLTQLQSSVDESEGRVRNVTIDALAKANVASSDVKTNGYFTDLTNTVNTIATLLKGYLTLTTSDMINSTSTCDDAASKIAFIKYKWQKYYQSQLEAGKNTTFILVQYNTLNALYTINLASFSDSQKKNVQLVIDALSTLSDSFRQYILSLITAQVKLLQLQFDANQARSVSCSCTGVAGNNSTGKLQLML